MVIKRSNSVVTPEFQGRKIFDELHLYTDGAARGNPGPAGIGSVITTPQGKVVATISDSIGEATNNYAEYTALIHSLRLVSAFNVDKIRIHSDSELLVQQLKGNYRVKEPSLRSLHQQALSMLRRYRDWRIVFIPRSSNREADRLANAAIDDYLSSHPNTEKPGGKKSDQKQSTLFDS